jgi:hypothetical protein
MNMLHGSSRAIALAGAAPAIATFLIATSAAAQSCPDADSPIHEGQAFRRDASVLCWTGPRDDYDLGTSRSLTTATWQPSENKSLLTAYKFSGATETAHAFGYDTAFNLVCYAQDTTRGDGPGQAAECDDTLFYIYSVAGPDGLDALEEHVGGP